MSRILSKSSLRSPISVIRECCSALSNASILKLRRYYKESHKILGNTYGMLVLQDFEAITPNLLARTIETVEGGGLVVLLLKTMSSLRQLYTMTMVRDTIFCAKPMILKSVRMYMRDIGHPRMIQLSRGSTSGSSSLLAHVTIAWSWTTN